MTRSAVLEASLNQRGWKNEAQEGKCWNKPEREKGGLVLGKGKKSEGKERVGRFLDFRDKNGGKTNQLI